MDELTAKTKLPANFQFSQGSLQDYADCPRLFQLRHLLRVAWPAITCEPALENERYLRQGDIFHHMVYQHLLGVPEQRLSSMAGDQDLQRWWENYTGDRMNLQVLSTPDSKLFLEFSLSAPLWSEMGVSPYRLVAKYDLIVVQDKNGGSRLVIFDWKTSRSRPKRAWLENRLQTRLYPYLLVLAGAALTKTLSIKPEQIEMIYWFANYPAQPERFVYDSTLYTGDSVYLAQLVCGIEKMVETGFPLAPEQEGCGYCTYSSLCERGPQVSRKVNLEDQQENNTNLNLDLDFEQIPEVKF